MGRPLVLTKATNGWAASALSYTQVGRFVGATNAALMFTTLSMDVGSHVVVVIACTRVQLRMQKHNCRRGLKRLRRVLDLLHLGE